MNENALIEIIMTPDGLSYEINDEFVTSFIKQNGSDKIKEVMSNALTDIEYLEFHFKEEDTIFNGMVSDIMKGFE
jgi:hypothetical protein